MIGTEEQVADGFAMLSAMALDGALLARRRFEDGMRTFKNVT